MANAVACATETVQAGIAVARVELLDDLFMGVINRHNGLGYPETATLFLEFHGSCSEVEDQAASVRDIAEGHGGSGWRHAAGADERAKLWQARHNLHYALLALSPPPSPSCTRPISRRATGCSLFRRC